MNKPDERNEAWYMQETAACKMLLLDFYTHITHLGPDWVSPTQDPTPALTSAQQQYHALRSIVLSMKECIELLQLPDLNQDTGAAGRPL